MPRTGGLRTQTLRGGAISKWTPQPWTEQIASGAALIALGVIAVIGFKNYQEGQTAPVVRTYATTVGQRATVTLEDGSQALLGPATTLSVTSQSSDASVDVRVEGQASFTVTHRNERPFRVHAGQAITRVLGTTFMVRRYDSDPITRVVVTNGRVSLNSTRARETLGTNHVLTAGTLGTVDDSGRVRVTPIITAEDYTAWTQGRLVFRQSAMSDVVAELSRAYGAEIRVADPKLAARTLDWTVSVTQQSLTDVLDFLGVLLDVRPIRSGSVITLVSGQSASRKPVDLRPTLKSESSYGR